MTVTLASWIFAMTVAGAATQADVDAVAACLHRQDVACAKAIVDREHMAQDADPVLLSVAAEVAFQDADYVQAMELQRAAVAAGLEDERDTLGLYERTVYATAGWVERDVGRFAVRYRPGVDAILVSDAIETMERTDRWVTPRIGTPPPGRSVVELYPDGRSFIAASSLNREDVESTGVVAISKWTRLLVSSPRALGRGYEWRSTLSHEYLHLVVAANTDDKAPVWLQEAIAKYLDNRWETGRNSYGLDPREQGYLATALADNALVPFEEMHPSLAKIKVIDAEGEIDRQASAERASLAYAQLSSLMAYAFERGGEDVLLRALPMVRSGTDPRVALATAVGVGSFTTLLADWEVWIRSQKLISKRIAQMPTVLDGGSEDELDPVLSQRRDLANFLRLGDLLAQRERYRAALVEYASARDEEDPNSPLLAVRLARAHVALGDAALARTLLETSLVDYPTYPLTWRALAALDVADGQAQAAIRHYRKALSLAPFDLEAQSELLELYKQTGALDQAAHQEALVTILRRGGEDDAPAPLHTIFGEYELPQGQVRTDVPRSGPTAMAEQRAPDVTVETLDGTTIRLSELRGRVVILDFWATWCGPCRAVMPDLSAMAKKWGDQGLTVLGITDEPTSTVKRFLATQAQRGVTYDHTLVLESGAARKSYLVSSIPQLVVIDQGGIIRLVHVGGGRMAEIESLVAGLLGVAPVDVNK